MKSEHQNPELTFITAKQIIRVLTHIKSYQGAWMRLSRIKDSLGKEKHQRLTVKEFAEYEGLNAAAIMNVISE